MPSLLSRVRNVFTDELAPVPEASARSLTASPERIAGREDVVHEISIALDRMGHRIRSEWARELATGDTPEAVVNTHFQAQVLAHNEAAFAVHSIYNAGLVEDVSLPEILHPEAVEAGAARQAHAARQILAELDYGPALLNDSLPAFERQKAPELTLQRSLGQAPSASYECERTRDYGMEMGL